MPSEHTERAPDTENSTDAAVSRPLLSRTWLNGRCWMFAPAIRMFAERVGVPDAHAGVDGPAVADDVEGARSGLLAELTDHVTLSVARAFTATDRTVVPGRNWSG